MQKRPAVLLSFLMCFICLWAFTSHAQSPVKIGTFVNGEYRITAKPDQLLKAAEWTLHVTSLKPARWSIERKGSLFYLMLNSVSDTMTRLAAIGLEVQGMNFLVSTGAVFKTCSNAACEHCRFFIEKNKIVGCLCEEKSTMSNQCHYTSGTSAGFHQNLQRAMKAAK